MHAFRFSAVILLACAFSGFSAYRDFFSDASSRSERDPGGSGNTIYRFGFYNDANLSGKDQPINLKATYIQGSPITDGDSGFVFLSNFDATIPNGKTYGRLVKKTDGTYDGTVLAIGNQVKRIWYYQRIKGKDAGAIYKIHHYARGNNSTCAQDLTDWSTYCIPGTSWIYVLGRFEENAAGKITTYGNGNFYACLIDTRLFSDTSRDDYYTYRARIASPDGYLDPPSVGYGMGSNSLDGLAGPTRTGIASLDQFNAVPKGSGTPEALIGYITLNLASTVARSTISLKPNCIDLRPCTKTAQSQYTMNPKYGAANTDCNQQNGDPEIIDHALTCPDASNPLSIFIDENTGKRPCPTFTTSGIVKALTTQSIIPFYVEQQSEHLTHCSFSANGEWVYACRADAGDRTRPIGLIRFKARNPTAITQLYTRSPDWGNHFSGAHQDHTRDDAYSVVDHLHDKRGKGPESVYFSKWDVILVDNNTGAGGSPATSGKLMCTFSMYSVDKTYQTPNLDSKPDYYPGHPFHPHPSFSPTGNFVAFQYQTKSPTYVRPVAAVGVMATQIRPKGPTGLPLY